MVHNSLPERTTHVRVATTAKATAQAVARGLIHLRRARRGDCKVCLGARGPCGKQASCHARSSSMAGLPRAGLLLARFMLCGPSDSILESHLQSKMALANQEQDEQRAREERF